MDKHERPTPDDINAKQCPHFIFGIVSSPAFFDTLSDSNVDIVIANPVACQSIPRYIWRTWIQILPSINADVLRICKLALEAEADNSNQHSEGGVSIMKRDMTRKMHCDDRALFVLWFWPENKFMCPIWNEQLQKIVPMKEKINARRLKQSLKLTPFQTQDMIDNQKDVPFMKNKPRSVL